ncbi:MAG: hypothetical protein ACP5IL_05140 [Syntrophobacteraceae bacterium]
MAKDFVQVKILDFPAPGGGCSCGASLRGPQYMEMLLQKCAELKEALEASFPGKTSTNFFDLTLCAEEKDSEPGRLLAHGEYQWR